MFSQPGLSRGRLFGARVESPLLLEGFFNGLGDIGRRGGLRLRLRAEVLGPLGVGFPPDFDDPGYAPCATFPLCDNVFGAVVHVLPGLGRLEELGSARVFRGAGQSRGFAEAAAVERVLATGLAAVAIASVRKGSFSGRYRRARLWWSGRLFRRLRLTEEAAAGREGRVAAEAPVLHEGDGRDDGGGSRRHGD